MSEKSWIKDLVGGNKKASKAGNLFTQPRPRGTGEPIDHGPSPATVASSTDNAVAFNVLSISTIVPETAAATDATARTSDAVPAGLPPTTPGNEPSAEGLVSSETASAAKTTAKDSYGPLGLTELTRPASQLAILDAQAPRLEYPLDIVALHGITGGSYRTFTSSTGVLWLRDFLLEDLPGTRVFTYGYDARVFFTKATGTLNEFALALLEGLKQLRYGMVCSFRRASPYYPSLLANVYLPGQETTHHFHLPQYGWLGRQTG